ncbi:MAG: putative cation-translocating P-type ATPase, partial [Streblomastix strix]
TIQLTQNYSLQSIPNSQLRKTLPPSQHDFEFEFVGLLGFVDPIRPEVPDAIQQCRQAGIKVCMITGDLLGTAVNVAKKIGIPSDKFCETCGRQSPLATPRILNPYDAIIFTV